MRNKSNPKSRNAKYYSAIYQKASPKQKNILIEKYQLSDKKNSKALAQFLIKDLEQNAITRNQIKNALDCSEYKYNIFNEIITLKCKTRLCLSCTKLTGRKMQRYYGKQIEDMHEKYMVTLTTKTCSYKELPIRILDFNKVWTNIISTIRKQKSRNTLDFTFNGIRKIECHVTHDKKYHLHLHILVDSKKAADYIKSKWISQWQKKYPTRSLVNEHAQNIRIADTKAIKELLKYMFKISTKSGKIVDALELTDKKLRTYKVTAKQFLRVIECLTNKKTIIPFGNMVKVKDSDLNQHLTEKEKYERLAELHHQQSSDLGYKFSDLGYKNRKGNYLKNQQLLKKLNS